MAAPMSMCDEIIKKYVKNDDKEGIIVIYNGLQSGSIKLLTIVESLGVYLTSEETSERCSGTQMLAEVLAMLPKDAISTKEGGVLTTFLCDRIKDHHSVQPHVLHAISTVCSSKNISAENLHELLRSVNKELHLQSLTQKDRRYYYNMILHLLTHRLQDIQRMESDFVYCYMQAMDGEKDPRNLILGFKCVKIIAQYIPLGVFAEDLFEVVACYFPVDFTPPPNDPFGIKKEELVLELRECMSASPKFAEFCLPLLLEKITSSVQSAKVDAFLTLKCCAPVYGALALKEFLGSFWSAIQREVMSGMSGSVETAALAALTAVTNTLSLQYDSGHTAELHSFIKDAFNDVQRHIREPEQRLALPSAKLLQTVAMTSQHACHVTTGHVVPLVLQLFHKHTQTIARRVILDIIINFIKVVKTLKFSPDKNPLTADKDSLYTLLTSMLSDTNPQLRCHGVAGLVGLLGMQELLSDDHRVNVAEYMLSAVMKDCDSAVRKESISALTYMSIEYPHIIKQHVLDTLSNALQHESMETDDMKSEVGIRPGLSDHVTCEYLLNAIASLSTSLDLVTKTIPWYIRHLHKLCEKNTKELPYKTLVKEAECVCTSLTAIVNNSVNNNEECIDHFYTYLLPECLKLAASGMCENEQHKDDGHLLADVEVVRCLCVVIRAVTCKLNTQQCASLAAETVTLFTEKESTWLGITSPFKIKDCSPTQKQSLLYFTAVVCSLPSQVALPHCTEIEHDLAALSVHPSADSVFCEQGAKCLAGLLNKYGVEGKLEDKLTPLGSLYDVYKDTETQLSKRKQAFTSLLWATKATVLSSQPLQYQLTDMVIQALKQSDFAELAADGFYIILNEYPDIMSLEMRADVKIMYRQRFFHMTMPKLLDGFNTADNERKSCYLTALSYLLRFVPKQVLMAELPPVIPLLIQSLMLPDQPALWQSTLNTVYDLIHDAPDTFHSHLDDLLPRLFTLTKCKADMKVRIASVQCLGTLTTFPTHLILPHRKQVIRELGQRLDDHKRRVRQEAATARGEWFLVGEPGK